MVQQSLTAYLKVLGMLLLFLQNTDRLQQEKIMSEVVLPLLLPNTDCLPQEKIMSEVAHYNLKRLKLFTCFIN
jgi:hypothetical protein